MKEILSSRQEDSEQILRNLGFGYERQTTNVGAKLPSRFLSKPSGAEGIDLDHVAQRNPALKEVIDMSRDGVITEAGRLAGQFSIITNKQELICHLSECALPDRFTNVRQKILMEMMEWMDKQQLKGWGLDTLHNDTDTVVSSENDSFVVVNKQELLEEQQGYIEPPSRVNKELLSNALASDASLLDDVKKAPPLSYQAAICRQSEAGVVPSSYVVNNLGQLNMQTDTPEYCEAQVHILESGESLV